MEAFLIAMTRTKSYSLEVKKHCCVLCGMKTFYDEYCSENGSYDSLKVKPKNGLSFKSPSNGQVIKIDDERRWKIEEGF